MEEWETGILIPGADLR